jgi:uncharacterized phage infection (PIP) family protein YhgE
MAGAQQFLSNLIESLIEKTDTQVAALQTMVTKLTDTVTALTGVENKSDTQITSLATMVTKLTETVSALDTGNTNTANLTDVKNNTATQITSLASIVTKLNDTVTALNSVESKSDTQITSLASMVSKLTSTVTALNTGNVNTANLTDVKNNTATQITSLATVVTKLTATVTALNNVESASTSQLSSLQTMVTSLASTVTKLTEVKTAVENTGSKLAKNSSSLKFTSSFTNISWVDTMDTAIRNTPIIDIALFFSGSVRVGFHGDAETNDIYSVRYIVNGVQIDEVFLTTTEQDYFKDIQVLKGDNLRCEIYSAGGLKYLTIQNPRLYYDVITEDVSTVANVIHDIL